METVKLQYKNIIIVDPCYIKEVLDNSNESRFDALKLVKVVHEGSDGGYVVRAGDKEAPLGVDSGRIWALQAEFDIRLIVDAGFSGYMVVGNIPTEEIRVVED